MTLIQSIIFFFSFTLLYSMGIWVVLTPQMQSLLGTSISPNWAWLGLAGPGLFAVISSYLVGGWAEIKKLFRPFLYWRVSFIFWVFIFAGVFFFYCAASWFSVMLYNTTSFKSMSVLIESIRSPFLGLRGIGYLIEITVIYALCEELGWRGFALPKLLETKMSAATATLLIGLIWTVWHIPLIYLYGSKLELISGLCYFLHIECMAIFYSWLYLRTNKSLLCCAVFHGMTDGIGAYFPLTASTMGQGPNTATLLIELLIAALMFRTLIDYKR